VQFKSLCVFLVVIVATPVAAQTLPEARGDSKLARAVRVGEEAVQVDGRLGERAWAAAPAIADFVQKEPDEGAEPSERTEIRFLYDDHALYIGARMYKRSGSTLQAPLGRRDRQEQAEHILIAFDTFLDRRTAYVFGVTAAGVRIDRYHARDSEEEFDEGFEPVWQARTQVDAEGWTAELWIPFSQLRFNDQQQLVWGLNVHRHIPTLNEDDYWAPIPRTLRAWSSRFGELHGIEGLPSTRRLELLPYFAGASTINTERDRANPLDSGLNLGSRGGADLKMGLGPNLTLEATFNPDFGQVEADPAEVNLTAAETFFEEKRPFFLEGIDLIKPDTVKNTYFYSRRIGERPTVRVAGDFIDYPQAATILGAAKLTGRLGPNTTIGALGAITDEEDARSFDLTTGMVNRTRVAARTAFGLARVSRQFGGSQSTVGGMVSTVHRDMPAADPLGDLLLRNSVMVEGDAVLRFKGGEYELVPIASATVVDGDAAAVARIQRSNNHLAQRPDRTHAVFDPTLTSLSGFDNNVTFRRTGGRHWIWSYFHEMQSPRWETSEFGRLRGNDSMVENVDLRYRETRPGRIFRSYWIGAQQNNEWNLAWDRQTLSYGAYSSQTWNNFWTSQVSYTLRDRAQNARLTRGGPLMETPRGWSANAQLRNRAAGRTVWSLQAASSGNEDGGLMNRLTGSVGVRPGPRWQLAIEPSLLRQVDTQQYVATLGGGRPEIYGRRYVFGTVDRSTYSTQFRLGYTLRPDLNVDIYAEPFAASGRYARIGELLLPGTRQMILYGTGGTASELQPDGSLRVTAGGSVFTLPNNDFNVRSFRSNVVLRWEYRPGSLLYVVWQQDREGSEPDGTRIGLSEPFRSLTAPGAHYFVIKTSYWLPFR
jgi:hypothetical protein